MDDRHEADESSELSALRSARPDPVPGAEISEQHRQALTAAMADERISPRWQPVIRRVAIAAAAVPVLVAAGIVATRSLASHGGNDDGTAVDIELVASSAFYDAPRCGTEPPPDIIIPEGYEGPVDGPSPDALRPVQPDQLVRHWTSPTGTIELRWYADPDALPPEEERGTEVETAAEPDGHVDSLSLTSGRAEPSGGRPWIEMVFGSDAAADDPCSWTQLTVFDDDGDQVATTANASAQICVAPDATIAIAAQIHDAPVEPGDESPGDTLAIFVAAEPHCED